MAMQKNNTSFKKGEIHNPYGRPKKEHCLTDLLKEALDQPFNATGTTKKQMIIDKMFELANDGDSNILKYLFDRIDGKPLQTIEAQVIKRQSDLSNLSKEDKKELARLSRKSKQ